MTDTIAATSTPRRAQAVAKTSAAPTHVPDQHSTTGAWILYVVCTLMALTVAASFWVASSIDY